MSLAPEDRNEIQLFLKECQLSGLCVRQHTEAQAVFTVATSFSIVDPWLSVGPAGGGIVGVWTVWGQCLSGDPIREYHYDDLDSALDFVNNVISKW